MRRHLGRHIETNHGCIIVAVIYRHSETNFQTFEISLTNLLVELENQKLNYVVAYVET